RDWLFVAVGDARPRRTPVPRQRPSSAFYPSSASLYVRAGCRVVGRLRLHVVAHCQPRTDRSAPGRAECGKTLCLRVESLQVFELTDPRGPVEARSPSHGHANAWIRPAMSETTSFPLTGSIAMPQGRPSPPSTKSEPEQPTVPTNLPSLVNFWMR